MQSIEFQSGFTLTNHLIRVESQKKKVVGARLLFVLLGSHE